MDGRTGRLLLFFFVASIWAAWALSVRLPSSCADPGADPGADPDARAQPAEDEDAPPPLGDDEAKALAKDLARVAGKRKAEPALEVLGRIAGRSHPALRKGLLKLLAHPSEAVATSAAEALGAQRPAKERDVARLATAVWKGGWSGRANARRTNVRAAVARAVGSITGAPLDKKRFKAVEGMWTCVVGDPYVAQAPALLAICAYVRESKDLRLCRLLALEIDQPRAVDVNAPDNPPAEWWKRRWQLWRETNAEIVETLESLTGQSFKTTADAKAWFKAHEKDFGFRW
ncbi:MAG: hypothetical protein ACC662_04560 [Planctomycetota bacterium]